MEKNSKQNRRDFITKSTLTAGGIAMGIQSFGSERPTGTIGANDKIRMGFIGIGNRGSQLLELFMQNKDVEIVALCDIYEPYLQRDRSKVDARYLADRASSVPMMGEKFASKPTLYNDYRKLLEDKNVDAVCIATPDHWHAIQMIDAVKAGKDVYVEKPLTQTIKEGRTMVNVCKASNRVVAVGLNRRGNDVYRKLAKEIPAGKIGQVTYEFASKKIISFSIFEASGGELFPYGEIELRGTKGNLYASQDGYKIVPSKKGQFQNWKEKELIKAEEFSIPSQDLKDGSNSFATANRSATSWIASKPAKSHSAPWKTGIAQPALHTLQISP